jgi:RNA-directed DNA polymerase
VSSWRIDRRSTSTLTDLAGPINQVMRGWLAYFTVFYPTAVTPMCRHLDEQVMRWARKKYKRLERSRKRTRERLQGVRTIAPGLFVHWRLRYSL